MPIYEYQCKNCGHQLETFQSMSDALLKECPKCHHSSLNRLISSTSFQLKGSGWYATDYAGKGKAAENKSEEKNVQANPAGVDKPKDKETKVNKDRKSDDKEAV